ncbi:hypothetical protein EVAR_90477_1 [Eumeta japonica]|uniref:Uncharacterized protein n=1 Tax=Eumeta variegata TaxID=151549 RepID=A0A4C2ADM0_EUMVA|nr:hypothetical protein EVAR_90477_1 [Eumeta japonica]
MTHVLTEFREVALLRNAVAVPNDADLQLSVHVYWLGRAAICGLSRYMAYDLWTCDLTSAFGCFKLFVNIVAFYKPGDMRNERRFAPWSDSRRRISSELIRLPFMCNHCRRHFQFC